MAEFAQVEGRADEVAQGLQGKKRQTADGGEGGEDGAAKGGEQTGDHGRVPAARVSR